MRFDIEKDVPRKIMDCLHAAIYQVNLRSAASYLKRNGVQVHIGSHVAVLADGERVAIITEEE